MERKTARTVMGTASSKSAVKGAINDPFPVSDRLSKDLDKLSKIAARILSTPDIYDIKNLANPGVCGEYAVFLKKGLEKKLLPFIADVSGGILEEISYQSPRILITDMAVRRKICSQLADTMLRTVATVVACLASIQVAMPSREAAVAAVPKQTGGSITSVRDWFRTHGYISDIDADRRAGEPMSFHVPGSSISQSAQFKLTLERTDGALTTGLISVDSAPGARDPLPSGSLRVQFLNEIDLHIPNKTVTVLPMRIVDDAPMTWAAGIFYDRYFKSFSERRQEESITERIEMIFRKSQGWSGTIEAREDIDRANEVFKEFRRTGNPQSVLTRMSSWISGKIPTFQAGYIPTAPMPVPGYAPYGYGQPGAYGYGQPVPYAQPGAYGQPIQPQSLYGPTRSLQPPTGYRQGYQGGIPAIGAPRGDVSYDIPSGAARTIIETLRSYREILPKQSSPAAVRANMLVTNVNKDSTVQSGFCRDPYWTEQNLSRIYPWATFQFLSIKEWSKLDNRSSVGFEEEWKAFISDLSSTYGSVPKLDRPSGAEFLEQMRFSKVGEMDKCKDPQKIPTFRFKEIQDGLLAIQGIYERHVAVMWNILNALIFVIEDPETKSEIVRLHPNVVKSTATKSSKAYVDEMAKKARVELSKFYIDIEKAYVNCIGKLQSA